MKMHKLIFLLLNKLIYMNVRKNNYTFYIYRCLQIFQKNPDHDMVYFVVFICPSKDGTYYGIALSVHPSVHNCL